MKTQPNNTETYVNGIASIFARLSRLEESDRGSREDDDWQERNIRDGAKVFKRKALGFFGLKSMKGLDEMAALLYQTGVCHSMNEAIETVPKLADHSVAYKGDFSLYGGYLTFKSGKYKGTPVITLMVSNFDN